MAMRRMVKVSVQVRSGSACFWVSVQAESVRRALSMVGGSYPKGAGRLAFPVEPEGFFVEDPAALAGMVGSEQTHQEAA